MTLTSANCRNQSCMVRYRPVFGSTHLPMVRLRQSPTETPTQSKSAFEKPREVETCCFLFVMEKSLFIKTLDARRNPTNRWTGAAGSVFRNKRGPAKLLGSAVARSTQTLGRT